MSTMVFAALTVGCVGDLETKDKSDAGEPEGSITIPEDGSGGSEKEASGSTTGGSTDSGSTGSSSSGSTGGGTSTSGGTGATSTGSTGSGSAGTTGGTSTAGSDPHEQCVARINELRKSIGLKPLARWTSAESCSDKQSQKDLEGAGPHGSFGDCGEYGQNTCPGWGGGVKGIIGGCLDAMWSEGPPKQEPCEGSCFQAHGHYLNMASTRFTKVACGFYTSPDGKTWSNHNYK